jgi:hypothetical protein
MKVHTGFVKVSDGLLSRIGSPRAATGDDRGSDIGNDTGHLIELGDECVAIGGPHGILRGATVMGGGLGMR